MTAPEPAPRPRQVTLLCGMVIGGSVLMVLMGFERVASLRSLDTRRSVEKFLSEPPGSGMGLTVSEALQGMRLATMVAVACAAATAILGIWLLRAHRPARIAASILAVPLFLSGLVTGGFLSAIVAAAIGMLWLTPARQWFAGQPVPELSGGMFGRPVASPPPPGAPPGTPPGPPRGAPSGPPAAAPDPSWASPPDGSAANPPTQLQAAPPRTPSTSLRVPVAILWACVVTWLSSSLVAMIALVSVPVLLVSDRDKLMAEVYQQNPGLQQQGVTADLVVAVAVVMMGGFVVWSLLSGVLAWLVLRRREWARITLVVSAGIVAVLSLVMTLASPLSLLVTAAATAAAALLLRRESAAWCRHGRMVL